MATSGNDWLLETYRQLFEDRRQYESYSWQICVAMLAIAGIALSGIATLSNNLEKNSSTIFMILLVIGGLELVSTLIIGRYHLQRDYCHKEIIKIKDWIYQKHNNLPKIDVSLETELIDKYRSKESTTINKIFGKFSTTGVAIFILLVFAFAFIITGILIFSHY